MLIKFWIQTQPLKFQKCPTNLGLTRRLCSKHPKQLLFLFLFFFYAKHKLLVTKQRQSLFKTTQHLASNYQHNPGHPIQRLPATVTARRQDRSSRGWRRGERAVLPGAALIITTLLVVNRHGGSSIKVGRQCVATKEVTKGGHRE